MRFLGTTQADGILERPFRLGAVPGVIWTRDQPGPRTALVVLAHGGGQHKSAPAVAARVRRYLMELDAAIVAIDAPGHGDRERDGRDTLFIEQLTQARRDGAPVGRLIEGYNADIATRALPEFSEVVTAVLALDEIGADAGIGFWGLSLGAAAVFCQASCRCGLVAGADVLVVGSAGALAHPWLERFDGVQSRLLVVAQPRRT